MEELLSKENILLILTGSSISIMERKVLSSKSPLYGRRQGSFSLDPLDFIYLRDFLPDYGIEDLIRVWLVVGGIPEYLLKFNPQVSFWSNVEERVLKKGSYLYEEAEILLRDEFKEPRNYKLILKAISFGHQTAGKICNFTGLDKSMVSKYLDVLKEVKIVTDFIPVTESRRFKGRIYNIIDPYFNFWFRFVYPNKTDLEAHQERDVLERIKEEFSEYGGRMFEHLIEGLIRKKFLLNQVAFTKLGKQWGKIPRAEKGKNTYEIDICAINDRTKDILFGECKWKSQVNARSILSELKEKARHVHWHNDKRKEYYVLFAKSFKEKINEKNVYLFDLSDIGRLF